MKRRDVLGGLSGLVGIGGFGTVVLGTADGRATRRSNGRHETTVPRGDSETSGDGPTGGPAGSGRIDVGEPIEISRGAAVSGEVTVDVSESSRVIVQTNTSFDGIDLSVTGIDPSPDGTLQSDPPAWGWDRDTTVSISYTLSVEADADPGTYRFPVSITSPSDFATPDAQADIAVTVAAGLGPIVGDSVFVRPGESADAKVTVDVSEPSFVSVGRDFVRNAIGVTITEIDPSPDATLQSEPPLWRWDRDTTVSISYTVSVDEDIEPGVYTLPVSRIDEFPSGTVQSIVDEPTEEVTNNIKIYASKYPHRLLD